MTPEIADSLGLNKAAGALVSEPQANSPAAKAGPAEGTRGSRQRCAEARPYAAPGKADGGVVVTAVEPNGVAADHGFQVGDVILDISGKSVAMA